MRSEFVIVFLAYELDLTHTILNSVDFPVGS